MPWNRWTEPEIQLIRSLAPRFPPGPLIVDHYLLEKASHWPDRTREAIAKKYWRTVKCRDAGFISSRELRDILGVGFHRIRYWMDESLPGLKFLESSGKRYTRREWLQDFFRPVFSQHGRWRRLPTRYDLLKPLDDSAVYWIYGDHPEALEEIFGFREGCDRTQLSA